MDREEDREPLAEVTGKPVVMVFTNTMTPSSYGRTRLSLYPTRVVEDTRYVVTERKSAIFLSDVLAVEYVAQGNPVFLVLGIPLILLFGLGIILIVLYFFLKYRFLVIRTAGYSQMVSIKGDVEPYLDFMAAVLDEVERVKAGGVPPGREAVEAAAAQAAQPTPPPVPPAARRHVAPATPEGRPAEVIITCGKCGASYRLPKGSTGGRFRCQGCQGVIEVAENAG
jgi:hypothetical protein